MNARHRTVCMCSAWRKTSPKFVLRRGLKVGKYFISTPTVTSTRLLKFGSGLYIVYLNSSKSDYVQTPLCKPAPFPSCVSKVNSKISFNFSFPLAARSKAWVCGRLLAGIAGSSPAGGMDIFLWWLMCLGRNRSLWRADHSSRRIQLTVVGRCVWSTNLKSKEAMAYVGPQRHREKEMCFRFVDINPYPANVENMVRSYQC